MRIAVVTEVSTKEKNKLILEALDGRGHEIINAGMSHTQEEPELTYIHTGLISALLLESGTVDLVVGGCGTGQGYLNSVLQYPGISCGLIETPLDAWLFRQINGGNCLSLALNKGFGWAGDANLRFIFDRFFSVPSGDGYPVHRKLSQQMSRETLSDISRQNHCSMEEIIAGIQSDILLPCLHFPGIMDILKKYAVQKSLVRACEDRLKK